ncbi:MAG: Clp protease N-terminal domain-containing protein [Acidimicrobiales bacterium]
MFERFTTAARQVVVLAQEEARSLGHGYIGTEHILLGLLREGEGVAASVLGASGVTAEDVRAAVAREIGRGIAGPDDADALRAIGIDLDAVRDTIEESFGPGAFDRALRLKKTRLRRRQRRCQQPFNVFPGHIAFTPRSKKVLEMSLRVALRLRHNYIGTEHILLAVLAEGEGLAAMILVKRGVSLNELRQRTLDALGKVA